MFILGNTLVSDDVLEKQFVCDLEKCKGACCVEGDLGAPLEQDELLVMEEILEVVKPYLSPEGIKALDEQGAFVLDEDGDFSTPTIGGRECAYAIYDPQGVLKCGIEQAWRDGKTSFRKPISCHLYPIRLGKLKEYESINYHQWAICQAACALGEALKVPVYKFLKEALIRKFGEAWYAELEQVAEAYLLDKAQRDGEKR